MPQAHQSRAAWQAQQSEQRPRGQPVGTPQFKRPVQRCEELRAFLHPVHRASPEFEVPFTARKPPCDRGISGAKLRNELGLREGVWQNRTAISGKHQVLDPVAGFAAQDQPPGRPIAFNNSIVNCWYVLGHG